MYRNIYHCRSSEKFFSVDLTTHIKGQPHSDPTMNKYTGDVVMMGCHTTNSEEAVQWLIDDSPRTPKLVIADAEAQSNRGAIRGVARNLDKGGYILMRAKRARIFDHTPSLTRKVEVHR